MLIVPSFFKLYLNWHGKDRNNATQRSPQLIVCGSENGQLCNMIARQSWWFFETNIYGDDRHIVNIGCQFCWMVSKFACFHYKLSDHMRAAQYCNVDNLLTITCKALSATFSLSVDSWVDVVLSDMSDTAWNWLSEAQQSVGQESCRTSVSKCVCIGRTKETQRTSTEQIQEGWNTQVVRKLTVTCLETNFSCLAVTVICSNACPDTCVIIVFVSVLFKWILWRLNSLVPWHCALYTL